MDPFSFFSTGHIFFIIQISDGVLILSKSFNKFLLIIFGIVSFLQFLGGVIDVLFTAKSKLFLLEKIHLCGVWGGIFSEVNTFNGLKFLNQCGFCGFGLFGLLFHQTVLTAGDPKFTK